MEPLKGTRQRGLRAQRTGANQQMSQGGFSKPHQRDRENKPVCLWEANNGGGGGGGGCVRGLQA